MSHQYGEKTIDLARRAIDAGDEALARHLLMQDGKCGACGAAGWNTDLSLDETEEGVVRGALCDRCLRSDLTGYSPSDLRGMAEYLEGSWDQVRHARVSGWVAAWREGSNVERISEDTGYPAPMIESAVRKAATRGDAAARLTKMRNS